MKADGEQTGSDALWSEDRVGAPAGRRVHTHRATGAAITEKTTQQRPPNRTVPNGGKGRNLKVSREMQMQPNENPSDLLPSIAAHTSDKAP